MRALLRHTARYSTPPTLLIGAAAEIYAALAMSKVRLSGWRVALAIEVAATIQWLLNLGHDPNSAWLGLPFLAPHLIFLLWLRRYFPRKESLGS